MGERSCDFGRGAGSLVVVLLRDGFFDFAAKLRRFLVSLQVEDQFFPHDISLDQFQSFLFAKFFLLFEVFFARLFFFICLTF
jgi:hypothetical protein